MKLVPQEAPMGCGLACAAAAVNLSYKQMRKYFDNGKTKESSSGFYNRDIIKALSKINIEARAFSAKRWGNKEIKPGNIVFIGKSKLYPFGHYLLKTSNGWMNPWVNFPYINPAKAGFQKKIPGQIKWIIRVASKLH